jgi:periplasmic protein CpxP/Spy
VKTTIRLLSTAGLAGGLSLALAGAGMAQDQGGVPPPQPPGAHAGPGAGWNPEQMRERMQQRRQQQLQTFHDALGLRADQEAGWQTLVGSLRPPGGERRPGMERGDKEGAQLTTPQRLDRMAQRMAERQTRFQQHAEAIKRFYATLDARQQKTFDALASSHFGRFGMGGPGGPGGGRGGRGGMMGR